MDLADVWRYLSFGAESGCWTWRRAIRPDGYGVAWNGTKVVRTHVWIYEALKGRVPAGHELDHLCRNTACCNPDHLEPVTHVENMRRGTLWTRCGAYQRAKTHCPAGHPYSGDNLITRNKRRHCRTCEKGRGKWT